MRQIDAPDFDGAKRYALEKLEIELPPVLLYHSIQHTRDDVVPNVERLSAIEGIHGDSLLLVVTAAFYHDIGYIQRPEEHEMIGAQIAIQVLPQFGYNTEQISTISGIIMATRYPQTPHNLLEEIMADADLDILGREDFIHRNADLRREWSALSTPVSDEVWYSSQLEFLRSHQYFTAAAKTLREAGKRQNIQTMMELLAQCRV